MQKEVKLFMLFDILGDIERRGPKLWHIDRKRTEDVKNHIVDLIFMIRVLKKNLPSFLDFELMIDYALIHDLPEAITDDITKFEGIPEEEIKRVTNTAIEWLIEYFNEVLDFSKLSIEYENRSNIETKTVHMLDKIQSAFIFIKYQLEKDVDMDNPNIPEELRNHPFVVKKISEGKDVGDIFFEFHLKAVSITDEECVTYGISRNDADQIVNTIKAFAHELYNQKLDATLLIDKNEFPADAITYNRSFK